MGLCGLLVLLAQSSVCFCKQNMDSLRPPFLGRQLASMNPFCCNAASVAPPPGERGVVFGWTCVIDVWLLIALWFVSVLVCEFCC